MSAAKDDLRAQIVTARRAMSPDVRTAASDAACENLLTLPELGSVGCVAAYLSFGTEPSTWSLISTLSARGASVLLPVLQPDCDLDWSCHDENTQPVPTAGGPHTPTGPRLGSDAITRAKVVIVPALAVGGDGTRLGRGGGSYDRALARVPSSTPRVALLYDGEVRPGVPAEAHDQRVSIAVTPTRVWRFS